MPDLGFSCKFKPETHLTLRKITLFDIARLRVPLSQEESRHPWKGYMGLPTEP